jgi:peptidylprolyl isomerase
MDEGFPQWEEAPEMVIDEDATYLATIETNKGEMTFELNTEAAPTTVNNFVCLATNDFYDVTPFHRVIDGFMIQAGDPTGTGAGGPGYRFDDELPGDDLEYTKGTLAMANAGPNTQGSQFFIVDEELGDGLPKDYTIFGQLIEGEEVLDDLADSAVVPSQRGEPSLPAEFVVIKDITITVASGS